jgi:hypothetical protein
MMTDSIEMKLNIRGCSVKRRQHNVKSFIQNNAPRHSFFGQEFIPPGAKAQESEEVLISVLLTIKVE